MITLDIYVSTGCANCQHAQVIAHQTSLAYPGVCVRVLELSQVENPPEGVFATPTYVLNGQVVSLGNPAQAELFALIELALQPTPVDPVG